MASSNSGSSAATGGWGWGLGTIDTSIKSNGVLWAQTVTLGEMMLGHAMQVLSTSELNANPHI
jgi:hypothetical protein